MADECDGTEPPLAEVLADARHLASDGQPPASPPMRLRRRRGRNRRFLVDCCWCHLAELAVKQCICWWVVLS